MKEKKPLSKKKKIFIVVVALLVVGAIGAGAEDKDSSTASNTVQESESTTEIEKKNDTKDKETYSKEFSPTVTSENNETSIALNIDADCPDGTLLQIALMDGSLEEMYTETIPVKDKKCNVNFDLTNTDPKIYSGLITLQFNASKIVQPDNTKEAFGEKGELLEGDTSEEANFEDGSKGKIASSTFTVYYPSEQAIQETIDAAFNEFRTNLISASNGIILDISDEGNGIFRMMVSNEWYLSSDQDKQYFAEEMLKTFTTLGQNMYGRNSVTFSIYDESMNQVASSKITGGMKIKK